MRYTLGRENHPHTRAGPAAAGQLRTAASRLTRDGHGSDADRDTATDVHRARVAVKKARAALRLVEHTDPAAAARAHDHLRSISHALARARDADAVCELGAWLLRHQAETGRERRALRSLTEAHRRADDPPASMLAGAGRDLQREAAELERLIARAATPASLARGFERSTRRAVKAMRVFRKRPGVRTLHRWRRRTKDHLYQCVLMQRLGGRRLQRRVDRLKDLADTLGLLHDLDLAAGFPSERLGDDPATVRFVMARARAGLVATARREGARLFGTRAHRAVRRVSKRLAA
ncbi:MAG: CHAD domain-containing protein [Phycisphaerales bacterium JB040]